MSLIKVSLKDGSIKEVEKNSKVIEVAKSLSSSLAKKCIVAKVDDKLVDLSYVLNSDCSLELLTAEDEESLAILNHSAAHLLAQAVSRLFPGVKLAIGPNTDEGFYYDVLTTEPIKEGDLINIEKEMKKIVSSGIPIQHSFVEKVEAIELFKDQPYKLELIEEKTAPFGVYEQGEFKDLCSGPHDINTNVIKHFKLLSLAGAYWRGDSNKDQLQRIYGAARFTKEEMDDYLVLLQERKDRDHRKLGKELELFMFSPMIGQGLPVWLPNGMKIKKVLENYIIKLEEKYGYDHISTPVLGSDLLYKTSGHWDHYREDMFPVMEMDNETLVLRPMSCPHHVVVYQSKLRSYRDLPVRYAEQVLQHRYEASGGLTGMERVRAMNLTDSHVFVRPDQIEVEFSHALKLILQVLNDLNIEVNYYRLSLRDPENKEKYFDDDKMWEEAQELLAKALDNAEIDYKIGVGEAAFYGPKLDIQVKTVLGHDITLATLQLDFLLPSRFDISYIDQNGEKARPVMLHRGLIGTYERFLAILLEQYKGAFPTWLSPNQVIILPVNNEFHLDYAKSIYEKLFDLDLRVKLDERNEKLGYKIREAQMQKVPYQLVLGDKEKEEGKVTYRKYGSQEQITVTFEEFINLINEDIKTKGNK